MIERIDYSWFRVARRTFVIQGCSIIRENHSTAGVSWWIKPPGLGCYQGPCSKAQIRRRLRDRAGA